MFGSLFGLLTTTLKTWNVFLLNTFSLKDKKKINDKNKYITLFLAGFYIKRNAYICNMTQDRTTSNLSQLPKSNLNDKRKF